mmetsp:Transcript_52358/g.147434  ORF Transcript_52358/g.147434 Transcript_52358/m.147434 type:complete len:255 (-) Transcript_52358:934-1698(-)
MTPLAVPDLRLHHPEVPVVLEALYEGPQEAVGGAGLEVRVPPQPRPPQGSERVHDQLPAGLVHLPEGDHEGGDARGGAAQHPLATEARDEELGVETEARSRVPVRLQEQLRVHGEVPRCPGAEVLHVEVRRVVSEVTERPDGVIADVVGQLLARGAEEDHGRPVEAKPPAVQHRRVGVLVGEACPGGPAGWHGLLLHELPDRVLDGAGAPCLLQEHLHHFWCAVVLGDLEDFPLLPIFTAWGHVHCLLAIVEAG